MRNESLRANIKAVQRVSNLLIFLMWFTKCRSLMLDISLSLSLSHTDLQFSLYKRKTEKVPLPFFPHPPWPPKADSPRFRHVILGPTQWLDENSSLWTLAQLCRTFPPLGEPMETDWASVESFIISRLQVTWQMQLHPCKCSVWTEIIPVCVCGPSSCSCLSKPLQNRREGSRSQSLEEWHGYRTWQKLVRTNWVQDGRRFDF